MMTDPVPLPEQLNFCWPIADDCLPPEWADTPPDVKARSISLAAATLHRLTLGQVGGCPVTMRPCPPRMALSPLQQLSPFFYGNGWMQPVQDSSGAWVNCLCGVAHCGCTSGCEVVLPGPYVGRLDSVQIGPDVLDPADYKLISGDGQWRVVYRGSLECPFPKRQDLTKAIGQPDTFAITYLPAHPVDYAGADAAAQLAAEFAKACTGKGQCQLPKNVTSVVRQGVSMQLVTGLFPKGITNIKTVDAWVALWNPNGETGVTTQVWSPDAPSGVYES